MTFYQGNYKLAPDRFDPEPSQMFRQFLVVVPALSFKNVKFKTPTNAN